MKIGIDKAPNIMQIVFRAEPSDEFYRDCMRGVINLDLKHRIMSAYTDCGVYAYKWNGKEKEFLRSMKTANEECLLEKISSTKFNYEQTVLEFLEYFDEYENEKYLKAVSFFYSFDDTIVSSLLDFYNIIERYDTEDLFLDLDIDDFVVYDYPRRARTFARLFVEYVQPKIEV